MSSEGEAIWLEFRRCNSGRRWALLSVRRLLVLSVSRLVQARQLVRLFFLSRRIRLLNVQIWGPRYVLDLGRLNLRGAGSVLGLFTATFAS